MKGVSELADDGVSAGVAEELLADSADAVSSIALKGMGKLANDGVPAGVTEEPLAD